MKALYLDEQRVKQVEWDLGALKIIHQQHAASWIPLHKISHINSYGKINWQGEALNQCLNANISISFSDRQGYLGYCSGREPQNTHLKTQLPELLQQDVEKLKYWFEIKQQQQQSRLKHKFHLKKALNQTQIQQQVEQIICLKYHYYQWQNSIEQLKPLIIQQIYILLNNYGLSQQQLQIEPHLQQLIAELAIIIQWRYWKLAGSGQLPKSNQRKHLIYYYHQQQTSIERYLRHTILQLWRDLQ